MGRRRTKNKRERQITKGTPEAVGTWCAIRNDGCLEIGWGYVDSDSDRSRPEIILDDADARALTMFLIEHYPLDGLAGI